MATDIKFVFIATGSNRPKPYNGFTIRATRHVKWMVRELNRKKGKANSPLTLPALIRFVHFNWENDMIKVYEHPFPERGSKKPRPAWTELSAFAATEGTIDFDPKDFIKRLPLVSLSIVDIYRAVREAPRGTVLDVSIYSHGFFEGPVLANTFDSDPPLETQTGEPIRAEWDLDGRIRSDFTPHMGERVSTIPLKAGPPTALKDFREGFATGADFRIFGCNVQDIVDGTGFNEEGTGDEAGKRSLIKSTAAQVIHAAYTVNRLPWFRRPASVRRVLRRKRKPASVKLNMEREFHNEASKNNPPPPPEEPTLTDFKEDDLKELHYGLDDTFFPDKLTGSLKFRRPFTDVIKFIARRTQLGYIFKAAEALPNVTCWGAVPGVGGDFQNDGRMHVPYKTYEEYLLFFQIFMGIKLDRRSKYGRFDAAGVKAINDRELTG